MPCTSQNQAVSSTIKTTNKAIKGYKSLKICFLIMLLAIIYSPMGILHSLVVNECVLDIFVASWVLVYEKMRWTENRGMCVGVAS